MANYFINVGLILLRSTNKKATECNPKQKRLQSRSSVQLWSCDSGQVTQLYDCFQLCKMA